MGSTNGGSEGKTRQIDASETGTLWDHVPGHVRRVMCLEPRGWDDGMALYHLYVVLHTVLLPPVWNWRSDQVKNPENGLTTEFVKISSFQLSPQAQGEKVEPVLRTIWSKASTFITS